jgi:hypothetical protein
MNGDFVERENVDKLTGLHKIGKKKQGQTALGTHDAVNGRRQRDSWLSSASHTASSSSVSEDGPTTGVGAVAPTSTDYFIRNDGIFRTVADSQQQQKRQQKRLSGNDLIDTPLARGKLMPSVRALPHPLHLDQDILQSDDDVAAATRHHYLANNIYDSNGVLTAKHQHRSRSHDDRGVLSERGRDVEDAYCDDIYFSPGASSGRSTTESAFPHPLPTIFYLKDSRTRGRSRDLSELPVV